MKVFTYVHTYICTLQKVFRLSFERERNMLKENKRWKFNGEREKERKRIDGISFMVELQWDIQRTLQDLIGLRVEGIEFRDKERER